MDTQSSERVSNFSKVTQLERDRAQTPAHTSDSEDSGLFIVVYLCLQSLMLEVQGPELEVQGPEPVERNSSKEVDRSFVVSRRALQHNGEWNVLPGGSEDIQALSPGSKPV